MIDITPYKKGLQALFPNAVLTFHFEEKHLKTEVFIKPPVSEKEHERAFEAIKAIYEDKFQERYTEETGHHFFIYSKY